MLSVAARRCGASAGAGAVQRRQRPATLAQLRGLSATRSRSRTNAPKQDTSRADSGALESRRFITAPRRDAPPLSNSSGHTRAKNANLEPTTQYTPSTEFSKVPYETATITRLQLHQVIQPELRRTPDYHAPSIMQIHRCNVACLAPRLWQFGFKTFSKYSA